MKKLFLLTMALTFVVCSIWAQDANADFKKARSNFYAYTQNPSDDKAKEGLTEARALINGIDVNDLDEKNKAKYYLFKGKINNKIASQDYGLLQINPSHTPQSPTASIEAAEAFQTLLDMGDEVKKADSKAAVDGLSETIPYLSSMGSVFFSDQKYDKSYQAFSGILGAVDQIEASGKPNPLGNDAASPEKAYNDIMYAAALSAQLNEADKEAKMYFTKLMERDYAEAGVYEAMYSLTKDEDMDKAVSYLDEGRKNFPNNQALLYTEINHYLGMGNVESLEDKLVKAIENDSKNASLYNTLGYVYDTKFQKQLEVKNEAGAEESFTKALDNYEKALEINPKDATSIYSIGALYYNKAAVYTKELQLLEQDYSKDGQRKYEAKKGDINALFDKALPHFLRAESIDGNDPNVLQALKEIYARKGTAADLEKSQKYGKRLENLR